MRLRLRHIVIPCGLISAMAIFQNCDGKFSSSAAGSTQGSTSAPIPVPDPAPLVVQHVTVPVYQTIEANPNGSPSIRQSIFIQVGNSAPFEAMFDTGSTGLRILPGVLDVTDYTDTGSATSYTYGAGELTGTIGMGVVTIGGLKTANPIPIQIVPASGIGCPPANPNCSFQGASTIFGYGSTGQGFKAIIGVSLKADVVPNPLTLLGNHSWIIDLAIQGQSAVGNLFLNPISADLAGYTLFQLARQTTTTNGAAPLWADNQLPGCVINGANGNSTCAGTSLDTGAFDIHDIPAQTSVKSFTDGIQATLRFTNADGVNVDENFTVGAVEGSEVVLSADQTTVRNMNTGPLPFWTFDVLYQADTGFMGLKAR